MRKILFIFILSLSCALWAIEISFDSGMASDRVHLPFNAEIDGGFYGAADGNIDIYITNPYGKSGTLYAEIIEPLNSPEGFTFADNVLQWKFYYTDDDKSNPLITPAAPKESWTTYRRREIPILRINPKTVTTPPVRVQLGTTLQRVPSCQPDKTYAAKIHFRVEEN